MSDKAHSVIEIMDDGMGMDYNDLAEKYVWIGRNKREDTDILAEDRKNVMGRKGIGKLAALFLSNKTAFCIHHTIRIFSIVISARVLQFVIVMASFSSAFSSGDRPSTVFSTLLAASSRRATASSRDLTTRVT